MTPRVLTVTAEAETSAEELTTVCNGWGITHPEIVLKQGKPGSPKSHGMCERCELYMQAQLNHPDDALGLAQYRAYLESPIDPRD